MYMPSEQDKLLSVLQLQTRYVPKSTGRLMIIPITMFCVAKNQARLQWEKLLRDKLSRISGMFGKSAKINPKIFFIRVICENKSRKKIPKIPQILRVLILRKFLPLKYRNWIILTLSFWHDLIHFTNEFIV